MNRIPEVELMIKKDEATAYALANFDEPHDKCIEMFYQLFGNDIGSTVLDLGCGPGDISRRYLKKYVDARIDAIDGSQVMIDASKHIFVRESQDITSRINFICDMLPVDKVKNRAYDVILCNSLLHHLADPMQLWQTVNAKAKEGAAIFVMDLRKPETEAQVDELVLKNTDGEPPILKEGYRNSLFAAYTVEEVKSQLETENLGYLNVEEDGEQHLLVYGRLS